MLRLRFTNKTRSERSRVVAQGVNLISKRVAVYLNTLENLPSVVLHRLRPSFDLFHAAETALDAQDCLFNGSQVGPMSTALTGAPRRETATDLESRLQAHVRGGIFGIPDDDHVVAVTRECGCSIRSGAARQHEKAQTRL